MILVSCISTTGMQFKIQFPVCVTINVQRWRRIALVVGKIFQLLERMHLVDRNNKGSFYIGTANTCTSFPVTKVVSISSRISMVSYLSIRGYLIINTLVYVETRIYYGFLCVDFFLV